MKMELLKFKLNKFMKESIILIDFKPDVILY